MFQNKKLKRNTTYAIAEVAEIALCASNCALPISGFDTIKICKKVEIVYVITSSYDYYLTPGLENL